MDSSDLTPTEIPTVTETLQAPRMDVGPTWQEQDGLLRDLWLQNQKPETIAEQLGRSVAAIMTRAARLGLPRRTAPGRKPGRRMIDGGRQNAQAAIEARIQARSAPRQELPVAAPQTSLRVCLMCLTKFESMGRHNRICSSCKNSSEYESASSLAEIHLPSS